MEIARLPDGSLRIRVVPRRAWLACGVVIGLSLLLLVLFGQRATLACRRVEWGQIDCTLTRSLFERFEHSRVELRGLTGARLSRSRGRGTSHRVDLATQSGDAPLTSFFSSGDKTAIVQEINRFVADEGAADLTVSEGGSLLVLLFCLVFLATGLLGSPLGNPSTAWTFDRQAGSLTVSRRRLLRKATTHGLDQIRSATVTSGHLALRLASGGRVRLTSDGDDSRAHEAVQQIRAFLGLSSAPDPGDEAEAMIQRGVLASFDDRFGGKAAGARLLQRAAQLDPKLERASRFVTDLAGDPDDAAPEWPHGAALPPAVARPAAPASDAARYRSFLGRLRGVALFRAPAYRQVADDPAAMPSAVAIVLLVAALVGFVGGMTSESIPVNGRTLQPGPIHGVARMLIEVGAGLVSWRVSGTVGAFVARVFFRGRTDTAEMLRVLGYASVFRLLWLLPYGFAVSWLLSAVGTVIAMREAAEFDTPRAAITAAIAWVAAFAVSSIVWFLLTCLAVAGLPSATA